jgi:hypothetical protein
MTDIESIRRAISSGEIQKAAALWDGYAASLEEELRNGSFTAGRLEEARELVEWSRITVLCARAHAQGRLNSMHAAHQYGSSNPGGPALIRIYS